MLSMLSSVEHIVVLMLENRSFDHLLGFLYSDSGNVSPITGNPFEGLNGGESNPGENGVPVPIFKIQASSPVAYYMPGADPGEGYAATNSQLFGGVTPPVPPVATNQGFVKDYSYTLGWEGSEHRPIFAGTAANAIMGVFTPDMLPVLSGLARGYAVCDQWFGSVPTETLPNRAFVCAGTSQGHVSDTTKKYTCPSIFGLLSKHNISWAIYGYSDPPLTRQNFSDTTEADESHFGLFTDFQAAAAGGTLPAYAFLEPSWSASGNSQHPNYDVSLGEQLIHDVYYALRNGPDWNNTLLIITYDEHGGCYDHVPPPLGAVPPDDSVGEDGFDFKRFGPRVPTVLVSPLIVEGTVFRVAPGATPLDHTSILKTVESRWGLPSLAARDAAAEDLGAALTLGVARTDDPLVGVVVPKAGEANPFADKPSHLQEVHAELVSELTVPDEKGGAHHTMPVLRTNAEFSAYIRNRTEAWKASRSSKVPLLAAAGSKASAAAGARSVTGTNEQTIAHEGANMENTHEVVKGSERTVLAGAKLLGPANAHAQIEVTLKLKRMKELPELTGRPTKPMTRDELAAYGASRHDIDKVISVLAKYGLTAKGADAATRSVRLSGTVAAMEKAFDVKLFNYAHESGNYRGRVGAVRVPKELQSIVEGVFGLDNRRVARRKRHPASGTNHPGAHSSAQSSWYTGIQLAAHYDFPPGDGSGLVVGVLEFGGGYFEADLEKFCKLANCPKPLVKPVSTDGTSTSAKDGAQGEVMLDVEVLASVCPKSTIVVYFSDWSEQGWISAFDAVTQDKDNDPGAVSISWGSPEDTDLWTTQAMTQINESLQDAAFLGITVCVAAGDDGSSDAVSDGHAHADFPSSSPYVLSVGGTTVVSQIPAAPDIAWKEGDGLRADNGGSTGGGVSAVFERPTWQTGISIKSVNPGAIVGRCLPDLAANADWNASPYLLVVDGQAQPNGGTSAATPLVTSLIMLINQKRGPGNRIGYITPLLYAAQGSGNAASTIGAVGCTDVQSGNNTTDSIGGYSAGPGYDAVSGWGTPNGQKLLAALPLPAAAAAHAASGAHGTRASHATQH